MNINNLSTRIGKFVGDNSPSILTAIGAAGVVTTAYLAGRASFKAAQMLGEESPHLEMKEKVRLCGKLYIPAIGTGAISIAAIVAANRIGSRRVAAMATAFTLTERAFETYREKITETIGDKKERAAHDAIGQDYVRKNPPSREIIITDGGEVLCCEGYSGRYFKSSMEDLKQAQNALNYRILNDGYASLTEFYHLVGLPSTSHSDLVGWSSDKKLELDISTALTEDGKPCLYFRFYNEPKTNFNLAY